MIDYIKFHFATAPGTGAEWFVRAAMQAGLGWKSPERALSPFRETSIRVLRVSLVVHPCDWLWGQWSRPSESNGLGGIATLDRRSGWDSFVRSYLERCPGEIGRVLTAFGADSFIRVEDLPWAFVELVESLTMPRTLTDGLIRRLPPAVRKTLPFAEWDPGLRRLVLEAERECADRFDYC